MLIDGRRILFLFFLFICFSACVKEEVDIAPEKEATTVVGGRITTTGGVGVPHVRLKITYVRSFINFTGKTLVRVKATATTDKNGAYSLALSLRDDELLEEENYFRSYNLVMDMEGLDAKKYVMPLDITGGESYTTTLQLKRDTTYKVNFYLPHKRYVPVSLEGFERSDLSDFTIYTTLSWGFEHDERLNKQLTSNWQEHSCPIGKFRSTSMNTTFHEIPFALNDTTVVTLWRTFSDGSSSLEHHKVYVTESTPSSLHYLFK